MSRQKLIVANWKMFKTPHQAKQFFEEFLPLVAGHNRDGIVVCPAFPALPASVAAVAGSPVHIGAQDLFWHDEGAWTGEVCAEMLVAVGCTHVIVGHSERRQHFHETDAIVNKKLLAALAAGLKPIVCLGESLEEREADSTDYVLKRQYLDSFRDVRAEQMAHITIAYEPVWAIGSGRTATPGLAAQAHRVVRGEVDRSFGDAVAESVRILYGGSVKPDNAHALMSEQEIDGALVGGASLDPQSFAAIVKW